MFVSNIRNVYQGQWLEWGRNDELSDEWLRHVEKGVIKEKRFKTVIGGDEEGNS